MERRGLVAMGREEDPPAEVEVCGSASGMGGEGRNAEEEPGYAAAGGRPADWDEARR